MGWFPYENDPRLDRALVEAAREGAGAEARLMFDVGPRWDVTAGDNAALRLWDAKTAIQRIRSWSVYEPFWIEEPLPPDDYDGYRRLTSAVETYIAAGEEETTRFPLYELMDRGQIDVVQFDVSRVGGLTESRRVAQAAYDRNRPFATHCFSTGIVLAASIHLAAASPNAFYVEFPLSDSPLTKKLVEPAFGPRDGVVRVPEGAGLGIEVDEELITHLSVS